MTKKAAREERQILVESLMKGVDGCVRRGQARGMLFFNMSLFALIRQVTGYLYIDPRSHASFLIKSYLYKGSNTNKITSTYK